MGNFVRGLTLSVSGFVGMSLCMNYSSSTYSPYLVPAGLASVLLGVIGFFVMVSGMNRAIDLPGSNRTQTATDLTLDLQERPRVSDGIDRGRLDDPAVKI